MQALLSFLLGLGLLVGGLPAAGQTTARLRPFMGVFGSGDAQMYFLGPSAQLGVDVHLNEQWGLTAYAHYFNNTVVFEKSLNARNRFRCLTGAVLVEKRASRRPNRGMFFGAGLAVQEVKQGYGLNPGTYWENERLVPTAAIRFGHRFPLFQQHYLTVEINATGPYTYSRAYGGGLDLITQLSLGTRLVL